MIGDASKRLQTENVLYPGFAKFTDFARQQPAFTILVRQVDDSPGGLGDVGDGAVGGVISMPIWNGFAFVFINSKTLLLCRTLPKNLRT